jgi:serine/threonine protein kinase/outer membrane protein OmpA-like peptidoglycan-associated protein
MTIDHERWQKINQAYFLAREIRPEQREIVLRRSYGDDPLLIEEVSSLLSAELAAGEFLLKTARDICRKPMRGLASRSMEGRRFGVYRVLREIEQGGMGEVYLAERDDNQYRKQVAIKIIRTGLNSQSLSENFLNERQILADLDHPYIARLIDGGTTDDGLPYLVMEFITGERIDTYCDSHRLSLIDRLHLFLKVCSAVHTAHKNHIIHRDLKPANILITPEGNPKLLDFGVARLLDPKFSTSSSRNVVFEPRFMTPEYASPEQITGNTISVASDVYSLGILLYQLLSGRHPYQIRDLLPYGFLRAACEEEPAKFSESIANSSWVDSEQKALPGLSPEEISARRSMTYKQLRRHLSGDLGSIVSMAIQRNPEERYASVEQFGNDLRAYLEKKPVTARKNTFSYRTYKFASRNRVRITTILTAVAVLLLVGFIIRWHAEREKLQLRGTLLRRLNSILDARDEGRGVVVNTSLVIFEPGNVSLTIGARERLARIAGIILAYPTLKVRVEGYTDNRGDEVYNRAISNERAQAVKAYMVTQGVPADLIVAGGFGSIQPICSNDTEAGRQCNRRVEIIVSGDVIGSRVAADTRRSELYSMETSAAPAAPLLAVTQNPVLNSNLALYKKVTSSTPCNDNEKPGKAINGSILGGDSDKWCSHANPAFLQVDLGRKYIVDKFVVRHAGAGGEPSVLNTRDFDIQISTNREDFVTVVKVTRNTRNITSHRIPPTIARYVKLKISSPAQHSDNSSRIYEFEIYGPPTK